jgi:predicted amidohydrolase YtcJ
MCVPPFLHLSIPYIICPIVAPEQGLPQVRQEESVRVEYVYSSSEMMGGIRVLHKMDLYPEYIFYGGSVHTVDRRNTITEAIAISGNRILAVGPTEDVLTLRKSNTRVANLRGASLIPGIIDSHNHAWEAGRFLEGVVTFGLRSIDELKRAVREKANGLTPDDWLQGGGWIESQFTERRMPNRWDLDEATPTVPVVLERIFSACTANSRALELAGITRDTPDPPDGVIERDPATGEPNGILHRGAKMLVRKAMPGPFGASSFGDSGAEESIKRALAEYVTYGITGIVPHLPETAGSGQTADAGKPDAQLARVCSGAGNGAHGAAD